MARIGITSHWEDVETVMTTRAPAALIFVFWHLLIDWLCSDDPKWPDQGILTADPKIPAPVSWTCPIPCLSLTCLLLCIHPAQKVFGFGPGLVHPRDGLDTWYILIKLSILVPGTWYILKPYVALVVPGASCLGGQNTDSAVTHISSCSGNYPTEETGVWQRRNNYHRKWYLSNGSSKYLPTIAGDR